MNTRALVTHILAAKGLDGGDRVLAKSVAERLIHALRMQAKRGKIAIAGKDRGAIVVDAVAARITVRLTGRHLQIASFTEARVRWLCQSAADTGSGNGRKAQNDSEHCDSDSSHVISPNGGTRDGSCRLDGVTPPQTKM